MLKKYWFDLLYADPMNWPHLKLTFPWQSLPQHQLSPAFAKSKKWLNFKILILVCAQTTIQYTRALIVVTCVLHMFHWTRWSHKTITLHLNLCNFWGLCFSGKVQEIAWCNLFTLGPVGWDHCVESGRRGLTGACLPQCPIHLPVSEMDFSTQHHKPWPGRDLSLLTLPTNPPPLLTSGLLVFNTFSF